ncbi:MAG: hypothetical protein IKI31_03075 [Treponema sp.]|nr:hypothetical protein [Treponema sp.]
MTENASLVASLKNFDKDLYINQRRKRMYGAYSALVISLMGTFFTMGNRNSLLPGDASFNAWNVATYSFIGTSAACGTWFIYELVRYLMAADSTLPSKAKKSKEDLSFRYIENNITNIENNVTDNEENIIDVTE